MLQRYDVRKPACPSWGEMESSEIPVKLHTENCCITFLHRMPCPHKCWVQQATHADRLYLATIWPQACMRDLALCDLERCSHRDLVPGSHRSSNATGLAYCLRSKTFRRHTLSVCMSACIETCKRGQPRAAAAHPSLSPKPLQLLAT